jgi:hypothetical protein
MNELKILLFLSLNLSLVLCLEQFHPDNDGQYDFDIFVNKTKEDVYNKRIYPKDHSIVESNFR